MIKTKETVTRRHTYVIDDEKPETADNVFEIEWDEDFITEYVIPNKILAVKAPYDWAQALDRIDARNRVGPGDTPANP